DLIDEDKRTRLTDALRAMSGGKPVIACRHAITGFADVGGRPIADVDPQAIRAVVFAGLGNFPAFEETIRRLGASIAAAYQYPDHHDYTDAETSRLSEVAVQLDANALLTSEKDAVKLAGRWPAGPVPLLSLRVSLAFDAADSYLLREAIIRTAGKSLR